MGGGRRKLEQPLGDETGHWPEDEYGYFRQKRGPLFSLCGEYAGKSWNFVPQFVNLETTERTSMCVLWDLR